MLTDTGWKTRQGMRGQPWVSATLGFTSVPRPWLLGPEQRAHPRDWDTDCTTRCHLSKGTRHFPKRYCAPCACIHSYRHTRMDTHMHWGKHEKPFT